MDQLFTQDTNEALGDQGQCECVQLCASVHMCACVCVCVQVYAYVHMCTRACVCVRTISVARPSQQGVRTALLRLRSVPHTPDPDPWPPAEGKVACCLERHLTQGPGVQDGQLLASLWAVSAPLGARRCLQLLSSSQAHVMWETWGTASRALAPLDQTVFDDLSRHCGSSLCCLLHGRESAVWIFF